MHTADFKTASGVALQNWLRSRRDPSSDHSDHAFRPSRAATDRKQRHWLASGCLPCTSRRQSQTGTPSLRSELHKPPKSRAATFQFSFCFAPHSSNLSISRTKRKRKDYGRPEELTSFSVPGSLPPPSSSEQGAASWHGAPLPLCILLPRLFAPCEHGGRPSNQGLQAISFRAPCP